MPTGEAGHAANRRVEEAFALLPEVTSEFLRAPKPGASDAGDIVRAYSEFFFQARTAEWSMARALACAADVAVSELQRAGVPTADARYQWLQKQIPRWAVSYFG